jgi:hypothetical protein
VWGASRHYPDNLNSVSEHLHLVCPLTTRVPRLCLPVDDINPSAPSGEPPPRLETMDYSRALFPSTTIYDSVMDDYSSAVDGFEEASWYEPIDEYTLHSLPTPPMDWPCDAAVPTKAPPSSSSGLGLVFQPFAPSMGDTYDPSYYVLEPTPYRFPSPAGSYARESLSESDAPSHYSVASPFDHDSPPISTLPLPPTYSWDHLQQPTPKREACGSVPKLAEPFLRPKSSRSALFAVHRNAAGRQRESKDVPVSSSVP